VRRLVALALPGGPAFVEHLLGAWDAGDAVLPVDLRLAGPARARLFAATRPACWIDESGDEHGFAGGEPVEEGDALVMATSGSTGEPKGVVLTHEAVAASATATNARLAVDTGVDAWWACLPLSHIGGLSVVTRSLVGGVRCEVVGGFSEGGAEDALAGGATLTSLVPAALRRLEPAVADRFRRIVLGGQAPPVGLAANVVTTYGMTETGSGVVYDGTSLDGVDVRILDGEIHVRGPMLLRSYRDGSDPKDADGWLATGDGGEVLADGRLTVRGRLTEMIISGGENIWPGVVESVVLSHPAVQEAAVVGVADAEWGQRVAAYVVVTPGESVAVSRLLSELRDLVVGEIARFAAPREVVIVESLPRTAIGKIRRDEVSSLEGPSAMV
jgi:O-succinylbenzoic acid--CoA ligase